jgi:YVTN family beta-propeller protein
MLEFRILGPFDVLDGDRTIELGGARQRAVLAILLLHRGETVSVDRIVDLMWGEAPPATAVKTVQVYVSHLRSALGKDVVASSSSGYALADDPERIDAVRFERLVDEGRAALAEDDPARAAERLQWALALWRGPVLGDLAYEQFAQDAVARLEEQRLAAVEERIEADLRLGRHVELVAELEGLVSKHPLRERLRAQHMLALYRSGRQVDALESFRDARGSLIEELGLEPGNELREREQAILAQDPALDLPRGRRPRPPPAHRRRAPAFIGAGAALACAAIVAVAMALSGSGSSVPVFPDSVAVIDPDSNLVVADVPVGVRPEAVAADKRSVWVANAADASVSQIDIGKQRVAATIAPNVGVEALAVGDGSAWIADANRGQVVRLAADIGTVANSVRFPTTSLGLRAPSAAALGMDALWVASASSAAVYRIDTASRRLSAKIDVGNEPAGVAVADGAVWVTDDIENNVRRLMPVGAGAVTDTIPLGNGSGPIAAGEAAIWVVNSRDDTVSRIDPTTRSVEALIKVGRLPTGIAVGAGAVWVANSLSGTVSRIDPATNLVRTTIDVGGTPNSVAVAGGRVWVSIQEALPPRAPAGGPSTARVLVEDDPGTTDPGGLNDTHLLHATCARLMTYASRSGSGAAELVPELAAAPPSVSADSRSYTFRIRAGHRFSPPSGEPVTAAAFQRAIERLTRSTNDPVPPGYVADIVGATAYFRGRAHTVAGVSARGRRLTIRLTHPSPHLPARMATFAFCAVPPNTPQRPRGLDRVATAGPYYVAAVAPRKRLVLRRNPGYPGPRPQRLEEIEVTIGVPLARAVKQVEAGRADYVGRVPQAAQARLIRLYGPGSRAAAAGRQRYFAEREPIVSGYAFNTHRRLFATADMRRAVNYALDRRALARHQIPASLAGLPTDQLTPPGWPGFRDATIYPLGGPDLATARRLAGGGRRRGVLYTCNAAQCLASAEIVRANLAAIGIDLEIRVFTFREMFRRIENPREPFDLSHWGWIGDIPDAFGFVDDMFQYVPASTGFLDRTPLGQRMRAASRLAGAARVEAYAALDRDITAQAAPFAITVSGVSTDFFSARMGCQVEHPIYGIDLASLCVRK